MSAEILPFDFEEQAVRVIMRGDEPWFVAADVCRVLEIGNTSDAIKRLDDDEAALDTIEGSQRREMNTINESGLYALILTSRKSQAKRFRKWITSEVIPAIRRTGRYVHQLPETDPAGDIAGMSIREAELWLQMVREARLSRGRKAAASIWDRSPLPPLAVNTPISGPSQIDATECLAHIVETYHDDSCSNLSDYGLREVAGGLFVANNPEAGTGALFAHTKFARGYYQRVLRVLDGIKPHSGPLTINGIATRGVVIPFDLIQGGAVND